MCGWLLLLLLCGFALLKISSVSLSLLLKSFWNTSSEETAFVAKNSIVREKCGWLLLACCWCVGLLCSHTQSSDMFCFKSIEFVVFQVVLVRNGFVRVDRRYINIDDSSTRTKNSLVLFEALVVDPTLLNTSSDTFGVLLLVICKHV